MEGALCGPPKAGKGSQQYSTVALDLSLALESKGETVDGFRQSVCEILTQVNLSVDSVVTNCFATPGSVNDRRP